MILIYKIFGDGSQLSPEGGFSRKMILIVKLGRGKQLLDGVAFELSASSVFLIRAGAELRLRESFDLMGYVLELGDRYVDYFLLHYPLGRGLGLFDSLVFLELPGVRMALVVERLRVLVFELERSGDFDHLKLVFFLLLLDIVEDRFVIAQPSELGADLLGEFKVLLEGYFRESRSTSFYARRLGLTDRRLNAFCREWYAGKGLFAVVMERLILEAEYLLLGTDMPIKAIAYELGFSSGENFGMYFRRSRGISPLVFRNMARESDVGG